ncbi:MAG: DNA polymerase III subunit alpha, partial [Bacteroidia bacterium]
FYFKTTEEMGKLFSDVPEAIDNTNEIVGKIDTLKLKQDIMLPHSKIPDGFETQDEYLKHITFLGAKERYKELTPEIEERLNFELFTIKTMGFAGYFLIVSDFIKAGRDLGVFIGPGRGSAAGSAVAYCIGITNIDPIKYNLLFERFLNPDRKSMPDIDTDFDDAGRQKVIDYVVDKYGKNQVAQIVTYGTMAAKLSIKDVARVMDLPLPESNALAKLVPERPGIELSRVLEAPIDGEKSLKEKEGLSSEELEDVKKLREIYKGKDLQGEVLREAVVLEGSVRNTGIHAAGIIIAPKDLTEIIPVATSKETELLITQYDGKVIEDAGVIKMDFLGLKTLTIIRDALILIEQNHGVKIDIDSIPLDDVKTFELYQRAETNGTFQFESAGMQKYLRELRADKFEDLIAMNALYRPGPLEYIPNFIARKHGREAVTYDLPEMEEYLKESYGVTVYQEQVMLLSQKLAGFTKGDADTLRKAMGKKQKDVLDKMKSKFMEGCRKNGHQEKICEKIWTDWEAFASYAFNKSHSTCYAFVAFQTAYLKAHYPAEYMASVLTHNLSNIDKITFFMEECRRMGLQVLGPDVNESLYNFSVNKAGQIRFGLGAIKGVGEAAVQSIIEERDVNGPYKSIFDMVRRINLRAANKKTFENLAYGGAFDSFTNMHRAHYFLPEKDGELFSRRLFATAIVFRNQKFSPAFFVWRSTGEMPEPVVPNIEPWDSLVRLRFEKDVIGFYISGHPLDLYRLEMKKFIKNKIVDLRDVEKNKGKELSLGAMITSVNHRISKTGKPFGSFVIEDYDEAYELVLFGEDYLRFKMWLNPGEFLYIKGRLQDRYNQPGNTEFKISSIQLLSEVREKMLKNLTVKVPVEKVSAEWVDKVDEILRTVSVTHPGSCTLKFKVYDPTDSRILVDLPSRKFKVNPQNDLIDSLEKLAEIEF